MFVLEEVVTTVRIFQLTKSEADLCVKYEVTSLMIHHHPHQVSDSLTLNQSEAQASTCLITIPALSLVDCLALIG